jgi:hypothetical protein
MTAKLHIEPIIETDKLREAATLMANELPDGARLFIEGFNVETGEVFFLARMGHAIDDVQVRGNLPIEIPVVTPGFFAKHVDENIAAMKRICTCTPPLTASTCPYHGVRT